MRLNKVEIPYRGNFIHIEPLGDIHVGNPATDLNRLQERIEEIRKDKNRYWIGMGDYMDNIRPWRRGVVDKRWETNLLLGEPDWIRQWEIFVEYVKPIANKCIGFLWGNHEYSTFEEYEFERMVRQDLGVTFLGSRGMIYLDISGKNVKKKDWRICAVHGDFSGYSSGGALNAVKGLVQTHVANIYLYAHTHFKTYEKGERVSINIENGKPKLTREPTLIVLTGGFIDPFFIGADMYFDKKPRGKNIRVGTITVGIDPKDVKIHVFE
jgi:predicted phosphodiesterase